jgi:hypothetical protein
MHCPFKHNPLELQCFGHDFDEQNTIKSLGQETFTVLNFSCCPELNYILPGYKQLSV